VSTILRINGNPVETQRNIGCGTMLHIVDEELVQRVLAEKRRRVAHLADDRSTAPSPGRLPGSKFRTTKLFTAARSNTRGRI